MKPITISQETCINCQERKLIKTGKYKTREGYIQRYYCKACELYTSLKKKRPKINCPYCKSREITKGTYYVKSKPRKRSRYYCKSCNKHFTYRKSQSNQKRYFRKQLDLKVLKDIARLSNSKKNFVNKYDNQKKLDYSAQDIVNYIHKNHKRRLSRSGVHRLMKEFKG